MGPLILFEISSLRSCLIPAAYCVTPSTSHRFNIYVPVELASILFKVWCYSPRLPIPHHGALIQNPFPLPAYMLTPLIPSLPPLPFSTPCPPPPPYPTTHQRRPLNLRLRATPIVLLSHIHQSANPSIHPFIIPFPFCLRLSFNSGFGVEGRLNSSFVAL